MFKYEAIYENYFGETRQETVCFQLSRPEIMGLAVELPGGFESGASKLIESHDERAMYANFQNVIAKAYGEISQDGRRFVKSPELSKAFMETPIYEQIFDKMISDPEFLKKFISEIVPADNKEEVSNALVEYLNGQTPSGE